VETSKNGPCDHQNASSATTCTYNAGCEYVIVGSQRTLPLRDVRSHRVTCHLTSPGTGDIAPRASISQDYWGDIKNWGSGGRKAPMGSWGEAPVGGLGEAEAFFVKLYINIGGGTCPPVR